jgi:hypothetical protein
LDYFLRVVDDGFSDHPQREPQAYLFPLVCDTKHFSRVISTRLVDGG